MMVMIKERLMDIQRGVNATHPSYSIDSKKGEVKIDLSDQN